jgi:hypothetical protein
VRLNDLLRDPVLSAKQFQHSQLIFRTVLAGPRLVAEVEVLKFPDDLHVEVAPGAEVAEAAVRKDCRPEKEREGHGFSLLGPSGAAARSFWADQLTTENNGFEGMGAYARFSFFIGQVPSGR